MDVIFVVPPGPGRLYRGMVCTYISKANYIWQPQDFVSLSAGVPKEYKVKLFDCNVLGLSATDLIKEIKNCRPVLIVAAISSIVYEKDTGFISRLRNEIPGVRILVAGDLLLEKSFRPGILSLGVDLILNPMDVDLGAYIREEKGALSNIVLGESKDVSCPGEGSKQILKKVSVGVPRHDVFINRRYRTPFMKSFLYTTVTTQFGCPYSCSYCSWSKVSVTYRGYEEVLEELDFLKDLKIKEFFFGDPTFGFPYENARSLLDGMVAKNYRFKWSCYFNPNLGSPDFLKLMKKAGCHTLIVGVEDEDFDFLNNGFNRTLQKDKLETFIETCKKTGLRVCGDFIIGLNPSLEAGQKLVDFALKLDLDFASFNVYVPLMGSVVREDLVRKGLLPENFTGLETGAATEGADKGLIFLRNHAVRRFYLRPGYLLKQVFKVSTFAEFCIKFSEMIMLIKNTVFKKKEGFYE